MQSKKASDKEILAVYAETGSVWAAGKVLGMCGQSVHERLLRLNANKSQNLFSEADATRLKADYFQYVSTGRLKELAMEMGRTRQFLCRQASKLGLTDKKRSKSEKALAKVRGIKRWANKPHPRGMAGKTHSVETRKILSQSSRRTWATAKAFGIGLMSEEARQKRSDRMTLVARHIPASKTYSRAKSGRRPDIGDIFFRSSWEANYARYLNLLIKLKVVERWEFEPETFWFLDIKRGVRSYLPDFRVWYRGDKLPIYVEIKGYFDPKSKTKIKRFKKYYPQHKLEVIDAKAYAKLKAKFERMTPGWE